ncbi:MAG: maleylpyruvate isomerase family mycothiol-dependent enzyme [Nakamurella sp.]
MVSIWGRPIDVRHVLAMEQREMLRYLAELPGPAWTLPAVGHWQVRDVVAHLVGDNLNRLSRSRDGQAGSGPAAGESLAIFIDRLNETWVQASARLSPAVLIELLHDSGQRVADYWAGVDLDELGEPVSWASDLPAPGWLDLARDYTEYWVHQQQIREAAGGNLLLQPNMFAPVIDTFARALPHALAGLSEQFDGQLVRLVVDGAAGGSWTVRADDGVWRYLDGPDEGGAVLDAPIGGSGGVMTVVIDQDRFWRLCIRSLSPAVAALSVTGDAPAAVQQAIARMTSIITTSS